MSMIRRACTHIVKVTSRGTKSHYLPGRFKDYKMCSMLANNYYIHPHSLTCVLHTRGYSSKKNKIKEVKKAAHYKHHSKMELSPEEYEDIVDLDKMKELMNQILADLRQDFIKNLSLRTSVGSFNSLVVETPDGKFPLNQLGQIFQKSPQLIVINMVATPQYIKQVKTAIETSGMNTTPQQDGTSLIITIPKITTEHREVLAKSAKVLCNKSKDRIRDLQNRFTKQIKKGKDDHSQDLLKSIHELILVTGHQYNEETDKILHAKQQELLQTK